MGINDERDFEANLQIGPTDAGMVRLFILADGIEIPMDFDPVEAEEIAEELRHDVPGSNWAWGVGAEYNHTLPYYRLGETGYDYEGPT